MLILFWAVSSDHYYYYNNNNKLEFSLHKFTHQIHHWIQNFTFSVLPKPNIFDILMQSTIWTIGKKMYTYLPTFLGKYMAWPQK